MRWTVAIGILMTAGVAFAAPPGDPQRPPAIPPGDLPMGPGAVVLLDNRFMIDLPAAMHPPPAAPSRTPRSPRTGRPAPPPPPPPPATTTRAELDIGNGRFVMIAFETFTTMTNTDFRDGVVADLRSQGEAGATVTWLKLEPPLRAYGVTPRVPERVDDGNLVHATYVAGRDGAVAVLAFYVMGDARIEAEEWARLARRITATLGPGYRPFAIGSADEYITLDGHDLRLSAPAGWAVEAADGVLRLRTVVPLGTAPTGCTVGYANPPPAGATTEAGALLDMPVHWRRWSDARGQHAQVQVELADRFVLHVVCTGATGRALDAARAALAPLQVTAR